MENLYYLGGPPDELILRHLQIIFVKDYERIHYAYVTSRGGHEGKFRGNGEPYFNHAKRTVWIYVTELDGRDPRIVIGLLLHDIPEDSEVLSFPRIVLNLGEDIAFDMEAISKLKGENVWEYLWRVMSRAPYTLLDKIIDRLDNDRQLACASQYTGQRHYWETRDIFIPWLIPELRKYGDIWLAHADELEKLLFEAIGSFASYYP